MKIVVLSSLAYSLTNFRGDLLRAMRENGHEVVAVAPDRDEQVERELAESGIEFRTVPMSRAGMNPFADLRLIFAYIMLMLRERPELVLAYTQKPIVYGGLVTRLLAIPRFFPLMSGLGHVFSPDSGVSETIKRLVARLYRIAIRRAQTIFVFNSDDRKDMLDLGIVTKEQKVLQVPGSGVDLKRFAHVQPEAGKLHFLLIARLLRNKGIPEFLEAARQVQKTKPDARFSVLGHIDCENPAGFTEEELAEFARDYPVEFVPGTDDVRPFLADSTVFVLPTTYREGLPRTILEAMATGRAIIATDAPGCRDAVDDGSNGFLVEPGNAADLARAMLKFVADPQLAATMGERSRGRAEKVYDVELVNRTLLYEMDLLRHSGRPSTPGAPIELGAVEKPARALAPARKQG
ncbi:glycosyltransferase family 4 protein [Qipengyuania sp. 1NDW9]|uniref:glycosyltransferase family 4 protein n=1 Tax=Qipengyuania xiapuensis TaxID=2867236 RepID=UPI001C880F87|nr:glycosyltransferase family 4 protein [Qipengyuania xiapuensis]MBX7492773.1 glycosyltransferase family 4 protein [Qipengyuania xiapuensis]